MFRLRINANRRYDTLQNNFVRSIVKYPIFNCLLQWFVLILISGLIGGGGYFAFIDMGFADFTIIGEKDTKNFFSIISARDIAEEKGNITIPELDYRSKVIFELSFAFLFTVSEGLLFTPQTVKEICEIERLVTSNSLFNSYCLTNNPQGSDTNCNPFGTQFTISANLYTNATEKQNCLLLTEDIISTRMASMPPVVLDFIIDDVSYPTVARSLVYLAGPLGADSPPGRNFSEVSVGFNNDQVTGGYKNVFDEFVMDLFDYYNVKPSPLRSGFFQDYFQKPNSFLQTQTGGIFFDTIGFQEIISVDQAISIGSYAVVLAVMTIYVKSFLLAVLSMVSIAFSLMVGLFLFAVILQIDYFTPLNILVLFLIAGVGADNVFVLVDAWRQSEDEIDLNSNVNLENSFLADMDEEQKRRYLRLSYAFGRAALSVSHTAMTTFIAFVATVVSPLPVIAGLGLYGSLVILTNWWYMFCVHPVNLMFWYHITTMFCKKRISPTEKANHQPAEACQDKVPEKEKDESAIVNSNNGLKPKNSILTKALQKYTYLVNETYFSGISLALMLILSVFMIYSTTQLETPPALESNFPKGHMFSDFMLDFNNLFSKGTEASFTSATAVFGILDLNTADMKRFSKDKFQGVPVFDTKFEIYTEDSQAALLQVCKDLEEAPCVSYGCAVPKLVLENSLVCPFREFVTFTQAQGYNNSFVDDRSGAIPNQKEFVTVMVDFLEQSPPKVSSMIGFFENRIQFVLLEYRMTMIANQPLKVKTPVIAEMDKLTETIRMELPMSLKSFYQTSIDHVWQHTERAFVSGLFSGLLISLSASFLVLLVGTRNARVALFAIGGVTGVVCSVLGTVRFLDDFALGTAETIAGVFVIGLSIDYIVHLGHMFMHSRQFIKGTENINKDTKNPLTKIFGQTGDVMFYNKDMIAYAIDKMGVTVLAGAITTFLSAALLSLCTFVFFRKMSILLMLTICYSVAYAFLYFIPMLRAFGPGSR